MARREVPDSTVHDTGIEAIPVYSLVSWRPITRRRARTQPCRWCGRDVDDAGLGPAPTVLQAVVPAARLRAACPGEGHLVSPDSVVLSAEEAAQLSDRVYQVRCAAEDVATAVDEGAAPRELRELCDALIRAAKAADGWR